MMRQIIFIVSFLIITIPCYSQNILYIKSLNDKKPLTFATIANISTQIVSSADTVGMAKVITQIGDTLVISYVGYVEQKILVTESKFIDTIFLHRSQKVLPEIFMRSCNNTENIKISNVDSGKTIGTFIGVMCSKGKNNGKVAVKIQSRKEDAGLLKSFTFWLKKRSFGTSAPHAIKSPFIISFYDVTNDTNLPGELLYQEPIFYFPKKEGKQKLKIDSLGIRVPHEGIYIAFEFIMDERYQWNMQGKDSSIILQGEMIQGEYAYGFDLAFFDYSTNYWATAKKPIGSKLPNNLHGTIKMEALIKYCK